MESSLERGRLRDRRAQDGQTSQMRIRLPNHKGGNQRASPMSWRFLLGMHPIAPHALLFALVSAQCFRCYLLILSIV